MTQADALSLVGALADNGLTAQMTQLDPGSSDWQVYASYGPGLNETHLVDWATTYGATLLITSASFS